MSEWWQTSVQPSAMSRFCTIEHPGQAKTQLVWGRGRGTEGDL